MKKTFYEYNFAKTINVLTKEELHSLSKKCPYLALFWSAFSRIWNEYREILRKKVPIIDIWQDPKYTA